MVFKNEGKTKQCFNDLVFLSKIILRNDSTRLFMTILNVETENDKIFFVTTDGRAMSIVEYSIDQSPLKDGHYQFTKIQKDIIVLESVEIGSLGKFPNWRHALPDDNIKVIDDYYVSSDKEHYSFFSLIFILSNLCININHKYLHNIASNNNLWSIWVNPLKANSAVKFTSENKTAIIMPIACSEEVPIIHHATEKLIKTVATVDKNTEWFSFTKIREKLFEF